MRTTILLALSAVLFAHSPAALAGETKKTEIAVLGAGCFWCVEAVYEQQPGVVNVISGYAGGAEPNPTYKDVSYGKTNHAEVVQIEFDPAVISYAKLLEIFWKTHDPTNGNGVSPDFGPQYRSILLPASEEQLRIAQGARDAAQKSFSKPIATEIKLLDRFYPAEEYHQDYVRRNPEDNYVVRVALPKLKKLGLEAPKK